VEIDDRITGKVHTISDLNFDIPFISTIGADVEIFTQPRFSAEINKTPFDMTGQTKPFHDSLESTLSINLKGIDLSYYFAYVPVKTSIDVTSGTLDVAAEVTFIRYKDKEPKSQVTGDATIRDLNVMDAANNPLLKMGLLQVAIAPSSFLAGKVHLGKILMEGTDVGIARDREGKVNIYNIVASEAPEQPPPPVEPAQKKPFDLKIDEIVLKNALISVSDAYKAAPGAAAAASDVLKLPALSVSGISLDTAQQNVVVESIAAEGCSVLVKRLLSGDLTTQALTQPATAAEEPPPPAAGGSTWVTTVKKISLQHCSFEGERLTEAEDSNLTLDDMALDVRDMSTRAAAKSQIDLSCRVNKGGTVAAKGDFGLTPLSANLNLDVKEIDMVEFQPFLAGGINATLAGGSLSAAGDLKLFQVEEALATSFTGDSAIADFAMKEKHNAADLLKWKQLTVAGIDVVTTPLSVSIKDITLEKLFSNIVINQDKTINLTKSMTAEPASSQQPAPQEKAPVPPQKPQAEPLPLTIGVIALKDGKINMTDRSVTPAYASSITGLNGTIRNISSGKDQKAEVLMNASINNSAPLKITGTLNPFSDTLFLDLSVRLQDMDLSPYTPYSGKYVGHRIRKGKLSLDLHYLIDDMKLDSTNAVIIDQFDFGDKVESPDAVDLPVKLGVSLLKDRNGTIKLNLPVAGRLDDPEFSVFGILVKVLKNLLLKAATSPFSLLGSVMGSSEDLSYVPFEPGSNQLSEAEAEKLATLAKALAERPGLSIDISGFVDAEADRKGLVDAAFERQLLVQRSKKDAEKKPAASLTDIAPEEYEKLLGKAYRSAKFEKPKGLLGVAKSLPAEEMEALIKNNISISDDDLRALAKERAAAVLNHLTARGQVAAGRLFLVQSPGLTPEKKENVPDRRVDLRIK
jgi:outer membrane protein OmpA-like peptidoglycan-associated protein